MSDVIVAGAGRCGLRIARSLTRRALSVTLVERLPACGGQEPEHPEVDALVEEAAGSGASVMTGTTAIGWSGTSLSTLGVQGAVRLSASVLVVATGSRPATQGELMIAGDRCAGILPGSAALHLMESGVLPGNTPAVLGGGSLARSCARVLAHAGVHSIAFIAPDGLSFTPRAHDRVFSGWSVHTIHGAARLAAVTIAEGERRERVLADALILAHRRIPMCNIEGAVTPGEGIVFCQTTSDPKRDDDVEAAVARAVDEVVSLVEITRRRPAAVQVPTEVSS